jgi:nicotinic acid mononucleotide adenylyltransferase
MARCTEEPLTEQAKAETMLVLKYGSMDEAWMIWGDDMVAGIETLEEWERITLLNWMNDGLGEGV